jgi:hypothetical protein
MKPDSLKMVAAAGSIEPYSLIFCFYRISAAAAAAAVEFCLT